MTKELIILISTKHYVCPAKLLALTFISRIIHCKKDKKSEFLKQDKTFQCIIKLFIFFTQCVIMVFPDYTHLLFEHTKHFINCRSGYTLYSYDVFRICKSFLVIPFRREALS